MSVISSSLISGLSFISSESLVQNQERLSELNQQLATGQQATTFGDLGFDRAQALSLRDDITRFEAFQSSIQRVNIRLDVTGLSLERLEAIRTEARDAIDPNSFIDLGNNRTFSQQQAEFLLNETATLLNSQADDRFVFGGNNVNEAPIADLALILEGDGTRDGLRAFTDERLAADFGANGLGRLNVTRDALATPAQVTLSEETATVFGFELAGVGGELSNAAINFTDGEPASLDVEFTGRPSTGEQINIFLNLPDGTQETIQLVANGQTDESNSFAIGNSPEETAENFEAALRAELERTVQEDLNAASRLAAAAEFFNTEGGRVPQRVNNPGSPELATGFVDATAENTVFFYNGQNDNTNPREDLTARVDDNITVNYGLRANEAGLREGLVTLSAFVLADFASGTEDENQAIHAAFATRVNQELGTQFDTPSVQSVIQEVAGIQSIINSADERLTSSINILSGVRADIEQADPTEVAVELLSLQTQIEASFSSSARISELTLLNFI